MKVVEMKNGYGLRYAIADDNGKVVDDAQGWGYKTKDKASKAMWWKFKNGKKEYDAKAAWWKKHKELWYAIDEFTVTWFKEMMRGEITDEEVDDWCKVKAKDMGIDMPNEMLKFAFSKVGSKMLRKVMEK